MGPDPENSVGDQDTGSPGRPVSSGLQVPGEPLIRKSAHDMFRRHISYGVHTACVMSGFQRSENEIFALLGCYAA
jgi:hypothetical protein